MCNCKNVEFGTYEVAIPVWYNRKKKVVQIDSCIALEVVQLWDKGIDTLESCCGHNKTAGYIAVSDCDCTKMLDLGYTAISSNKGCFIPKNIFNVATVKERYLLFDFIKFSNHLEPDRSQIPRSRANIYLAHKSK